MSTAGHLWMPCSSIFFEEGGKEVNVKGTPMRGMRCLAKRRASKAHVKSMLHESCQAAGRKGVLTHIVLVVLTAPLKKELCVALLVVHQFL